MRLGDFVGGVQEKGDLVGGESHGRKAADLVSEMTSIHWTLSTLSDLVGTLSTKAKITHFVSLFPPRGGQMTRSVTKPTRGGC